MPSYDVTVTPPTSVHHISTSNIPVVAGVLSGTCVLLVWIVALFLIVRRRCGRRDRGVLKETKPKPFILPPDPAIVQGSHKPQTFLFGKRPKSSSPDTAPAGTASTNTAPSTHAHDSSWNVDALSHHHMTSTSTAASGGPPGNNDLTPTSVLDETERQGNQFADLSAAERSTRILVVPNRPQNSRPISLQNDDAG